MEYEEEEDPRIDELELLRAMYSEEDGELTFASEDPYTFTLRLAMDGCPAPLELAVSLLHGYPHIPPTFRLMCSSISRTGIDTLMLGLASLLEASPGEPCINAFVDWLQEYAPVHMDVLTSVGPAVSVVKKKAEQTRKGLRHGTQCVMWEERGDLFEVGPEWSLCHCVSKDLVMGAGIAVEFKKRFGGVEELRRQKIEVGGVGVLEKKGRHIYYLVTKNKHGGKPSMETLAASLQAMRHQMTSQGVRKLAMPHIGCGLDRLSWGAVQEAILKVFDDDEVELLAWSL